MGQPTATEAAHAVSPVSLLRAAYRLGNPVQRIVPRGGLERRVAPVTAQRGGQPLRVLEQLRGSPPLAAQPAPVGREILLRSQVDSVGSDLQGDAALQRAVRAVRRRRPVIHASTVRLPRFRAVVCRGYG